MTADPFTIAGNIRRNLLQITDHYESALHPTTTGEKVRVSGADAGEPVNIHAVDVRNAALADLRYWVRFILDEVNNGTITNRLDNDSADDLAAFIRTWAMALAEQLPSDADNLERETSRHGNALEALAKGWTSKRMKVSDACPELNFVVSAQGIEELVPCRGELWSTFREEDNGLLPRTVVCDQDSTHTWRPNEWLALGKRLGRNIQGIA